MRMRSPVAGVLFVVALCVLLAVGGGAVYGQKGKPTASPGSIRGTVTGCNGADRVFAYLPGRSFVAITDDNGAFLLENLPAGDQTIRFDKGAHSVDVPVTVKSGTTTDIGTVDLTDLQTDPENCGACGNVCSAGRSCIDGSCVVCVEGEVRACGSDVGACMPGVETCAGGSWGSCVGGVGPINETCNGIDDDCDAQTDEPGACASVPNSVSECTAGGCALSCMGPYRNCDGQYNNGCESNVQSDPGNCGSCGHQCSGEQVCVAGFCAQ